METDVNKNCITDTQIALRDLLETVNSLLPLKRIALLDVTAVRNIAYSDNNAIFVNQPDKAAHVFSQVWEKDITIRERFKVMYLNSRNEILGILNVATGSDRNVVMSTKIIVLGIAIFGARSIITCHNHPSDSLIPSQADIKSIENLNTICKCLDCTYMDSLIINSYGNFYSFADNDLINN